MGGMSIWHWLIVLVVVVLLFGKKLPNLGGDLAKSIKGFKDGMKSDDDKSAAPAAEPEDVCGLCGEPGADKIPHPNHWPGERRPDTDLVHAECESEECGRAHREFYGRVGDNGVRDFLRGCS